MVTSIWEDVKQQFSYGNMVTRIIIVNLGVFLFFNLVRLILWLMNGGAPGWDDGSFDNFVFFFSMSSDWKHVLTHPWVLISNMFLHIGFFHILWNMLLLYWFGRIVGDFIGNQRILPLYILGGLAGCVLYFIASNLLSYQQTPISYAYGASAAVMAILVAAGVISPDYIFRLLFLGDVKLKYIVIFFVLMDLLFLPNGDNTGGHFAHLGGAFFGWLFVQQLRSGNDLSLPVNNLINRIITFFTNLFKPQKSRRGPRVVYKNPKKVKERRSSRSRNRKGNSSSDSFPMSHQEQLDAILDKIKVSGYDSLSEEEKEFLFNASKK